MKGKILFVAGLAVGYVLGSKAGRERYNQIASAANKLWTNPNVQKQVDAVEDFVKDKAPDVAEFAGEATKKLVNQVTGKRTPARTPRKRSTGSGGPSSTSSS